MLDGSAASLENTVLADSMCRVGRHRPMQALSPLQSASFTTWGPWDSASMGTGARDSPAVILGVHRRPPHFAKLGHRAGPHLSPRSFPRRSGSHASEVRQTRELGQPLVVSAFGDRDFLNDVSLPSLCRNSCRPQQEALPALHSRLLRQLRCLQVRHGSSCQAPSAQRCS